MKYKEFKNILPNYVFKLEYLANQNIIVVSDATNTGLTYGVVGTNNMYDVRTYNLHRLYKDYAEILYSALVKLAETPVGERGNWETLYYIKYPFVNSDEVVYAGKGDDLVYKKEYASKFTYDEVKNKRSELLPFLVEALG
jgi:hypothetical protein